MYNGKEGLCDGRREVTESSSAPPSLMTRLATSCDVASD